MATDKAPAFQFYPRDFVGDLDVAALTLEEVGAYTLLLCYAWLKDGLPDDPAKLAKALHVQPSRFQRLWRVIIHKFPLAPDGKRRNDRQEQERAKQTVWREKSREGGRKGQAHRNHPSTTVEPPMQPNDNHTSTLHSASASASSVRTPAQSRRVEAPGYQEVVDHYFDRFTAIVGSAPKFGGAEGKLLKGLLKGRTPADVLAVIDTMFASQDAFIQQGGYSIQFLSNQFNKLLVAGRASSRKAGPAYAPDDWFSACQHEPKCETGPMHRQREQMDALREAV